MKYTNRADLLIAAGESIKMQENAGIKPVCKYDGLVCSAITLEYNELARKNCSYEFPLAVVEGKAVFVGDELWCKISNHRFRVKGICNEKMSFEYATIYGDCLVASIDYVSWNPPKPKTVMVEHNEEDVIAWAKYYDDSFFGGIKRLGDDCRKALKAQ